jgi:6-phosphogluconolactonase (cycloisomerase 2 family)
VNLTSAALANPELGLTLGSSSSFEQALKFGGLFANSSVGESGSAQTITGLAAGSVWATLVPSNAGTIYANATLNGWPVNAIPAIPVQVLADSTPTINNALYITAQKPQQTVGTVIPGLQAVAASPDGKTLYGVNTQKNLLVVANASNLTQRQTFQQGVAQANGVGVLGTSSPVAVAVSPDGANVYVLSVNGSLALFSRSSTGDLTFQRSVGVSPIINIGTLTSLAVSGAAGSSSDLVFVGGSGGVEEFQGNTSDNQLAPSEVNGTITSISGLSVSRDGRLLYAVSASNDALYVLNTSGLSSVGTYTTSSVTAANPTAPSDTLEGASAVAVSPNDQSVYVIGGSSGTLTVFQRDLSTNALTWVQTLQDGIDGARGLAGATAVAVSDNGQYVYVTSG